MEFKPNVVFMLVCWNMIYAVSPERDKQSQAKTYFRKSLQGYPYTNLVPGAKYKQKYAERSLPFSALVGKDSLESSEVGKAKTRTNLALDYDVIETIQNESAVDSGMDFGFSAVQKQTCASACIRGLSGFCFCPPAENVTAASWSPTPSPLPSRRVNMTVQPPMISSQILTPVRFKRDEEDEEDLKLCKCRQCKRLFKRTLYCRVFPCYQKKCKSGEWRE